MRLNLADITAAKQMIRRHGYKGPIACSISSAERQELATLASFPKGLRVRLNKAGMQQTNVLKNRSGVVVGYTRDGRACRVRWDDRRVPQPWFPEYLVQDPR